MQAEAFKLHIGTAKLSLEETAHVSTRLYEMNWAPSDLAGLLQHIASMSCDASPPGMAAHRSHQHFVNIDNYLNDTTWSDLAAQKDLVVDRLTSFAVSLGLLQSRSSRRSCSSAWRAWRERRR